MAWLDGSPENEGRALSGEAGVLIVRRRARLAGFESAAFPGHSLRSGFITEGGQRNLSLLQLMELSGHADMQTVKGYYQADSAMANPLPISQTGRDNGVMALR